MKQILIIFIIIGMLCFSMTGAGFSLSETKTNELENTGYYELSQIELVNKMKTEIGLPVDCPRAIPEGIIERFLKWHQRRNV